MEGSKSSKVWQVISLTQEGGNSFFLVSIGMVKLLAQIGNSYKDLYKKGGGSNV
jgi:hypothetical protein